MIELWQQDQTTDYGNIMNILYDYSKNIYNFDITLTKGANKSGEIIIILSDSTEKWRQFLRVEAINW